MNRNTISLRDSDVGKLLSGVLDVTLHVLADDGLLVVAGHVMPLDAVLVKVVEDGHARLTTLAVVRLPLASTAGVGPFVEGAVRVGWGELDLVGGPDEETINGSIQLFFCCETIFRKFTIVVDSVAKYITNCLI